MSVPPYNWRAEGGYQPPPTGTPSPPPPYSAYITTGHGAFMGVGPVPPMPPMPMMPFMPPTMPPMPPMPQMPMFPGMAPMPPMPAPLPFYAVPEPAKEEKKDAKKDDKKESKPAEKPADKPADKPAEKKTDKKDEKKAADKPAPPPGLSLPGGLRTGHALPYGAAYTHIHVILGSAQPWDKPNTDFAFNIFKAESDWSVAKFMDRLGMGGEGMVCTECVETGQGTWVKGTSVEYKGDKGKLTLGAVGWDEKRGVDRPPVWVAIHKA